MPEDIFVERNNALVFAQHTRRNLELIESNFPDGSGFHPVTQLINSLLGLIVMTHEKQFVEHVSSLSLTDLEVDGWPKVDIHKDDENYPTKTLGSLIKHFRNAAAHAGITFSSDSRVLSEVMVEFKDHKPGRRIPYWRASLSAAQLRELCSNLIGLLEDRLG